MNKIFITPKEKKLISEIFEHLDCEILVFGSRVKGTQQKFSDLDICLKGQEIIPLSIIAQLNDRFVNSDLPYKVDLIDYHAVSDSFKKVIDQDAVSFFDSTAAL